LCTSQKECNKLDLTAAQNFSLVDHNDSSRWFAISSPHINAVPLTFSLVGLPKKTAKFRHLILLSSVTLSTGGDALSLYLQLKGEFVMSIGKVHLRDCILNLYSLFHIHGFLLVTL